MAFNPLSQGIQGDVEEGSPASQERPVLVAGKDSVTGNVTTLLTTGGALVTSGGGGGGGPVTIADGADVTQGSIADLGATGAGTVNAHLRAIAAAINATLNVAVTNFPATQPISGTVTANQGTPNAAGANSWPVQGASGPGGTIFNPVLIGGENGGLVKLMHLNTLGGPIVDQGVQGAGGTASWQVQGAAADNTTVAGNPLRVGVSDGTNIQTWKQGGTTNGVAATGLGGTVLYGSNGTTLDPLRTITGIPGVLRVSLGTAFTPSDGANFEYITPVDQVGTTGILFTTNSDFNGGTTDRHRNNVEATLLASAARTTTQTSADITTYNLGALAVYLNVTANTIGSITVSINEKDPASGVYNPMLTGTAVVGTGFSVYRIDPRTPAVANSIAQIALPRVIQIVVTANNANSVTYSVGYTLKVV